MKDCLILGPGTVMHYKDVYPLLKDKVLKVGIWCIKWQLSKGKPNATIGYWCTTLQVNRPEEKKLILSKDYNQEDYPRYDNYDAIECKKNVLIPKDYQGKMGVPITFLKYYPELDYEVLEHRGDLKLNGKTVYERMIIRRKQL